jgi:pre-mRNA-splicing factor 38B
VQVMAIYSDDENEPAWYEAVIDSRDREGEENSFGGGHRYWVTFSAYGNSESVDLGDMKLADGSSCSGGEDGGRDGKEEAGDLLTKVLDKERQVTLPLSVSLH